MATRRPKITEVAREAKVSAATVSRVLNNTRNVPRSTRARVLAAVQALNYEPDAIAQSLRRRLTHTVGVIVPKITNSFYTDAIRGIEETALAHGYAVLLSSSNEEIDRERRYLRVMRARQVDGIIVSPSQGPLDRFREFLADGIPMVMMHRRVDGLPADTVMVDNRKGTREAIVHLAERGYKRIAMVAGPLALSTVAERHAAYREVLGNLGLPHDESLVAVADYDEQAGYRAASRLLDQERRPTAIFVALNVLMLGVLKAIKDHDLRVPEDVALVGFDDLRWATVVTPPLSMVAEPTFEVGSRAAELLIARVEGTATGAPRVEVYEPHLVVRGSS